MTPWMKSVTGFFLGAAVMVCAPGSGAQEPGSPSDFERDVLRYRSFFDFGGFEPSVESILPRGAVSEWRASATVSGTYTDNYDQDDEENDAFYSKGSLGVGWLRRSPRLDAAADYRFTTGLYETGAASEGGIDHRAAGSLTWRAAERLSLFGGGYVLQNLDQGFAGSRLGVRSDRDNRSDEYGANGGYRWKPGRVFSNSGSYAFTYVDYPDSDADGTGVRRHEAAEDVGLRFGPRDAGALRYSFGREDTPDTDETRDNHDGTVSWSHSFGSFADGHRSSLTLSYAVERVLYSGSETETEEDDDYWSHTGTASYSIAASARTDLTLHAGYQWIQPDGQDAENSWNGGADAEHRWSERTTVSGGFYHRLAYLPDENDAKEIWTYYGAVEHRFSEQTTGSLRWEQVWDYQPASSETDATVLTETRRATARLESRFSQTLRGTLGVYYVAGNPREEIVGETGEEYWEAGARAGLTAEMGPREFFGLEGLAADRETEGEDDDYVLLRGTVFYRRPLRSWLEGSLRYLHERRDYDESDADEDYTENAVTVSLTASI